MSDQELSRKDRRNARKAEIQEMVDRAKLDALTNLRLAVGDTVPTQYGLNHRVPVQASETDKWFNAGEWYYKECYGSFTVNNVEALGENASGNNKNPVIVASAHAYLTCKACGRDAIISSTRGSWDKRIVGLDPRLPG